MDLYALKCKPIYKEMIWGKERWELTCRSNGMTVIENGDYTGWTLEALIQLQKEQLLGTGIYTGEDMIFPLLVKFIEANQDLSIQVHPDDEYAQRIEQGLGKAEAWYVVNAEPDAQLVYGLKSDISKEDFIKAVQNNIVEDTLHYVKVQAGDIAYIPAGTVHAIGKGLYICEIQQNSDTTYRVYDYNRGNTDGNVRELHIDKALDVIKFSNEAKSITKEDELDTPYFYFRVEEINFKKEYKSDVEAFQVIVVLEGSVLVSTLKHHVEVETGETLLIPAALGSYFIDGQAKIIVCTPKVKKSA